MIDSIFIENSPILRWFKIRQKKIKNPDSVRYSKKIGLEMFL